MSAMHTSSVRVRLRSVGRVLLLIPVVGAPLVAAPATPPARHELSAARIRAHVEFLADDLLEGREAGTRGYDIAAHYVATQLALDGLEPAADDGSWFQKVPLRKSSLLGSSVKVAAPGQSPEALSIPD